MMSTKLRLRHLLLGLATLIFGACRPNEKVEIATTTTVQVEGLRGIETLVSAADGTILERHFTLSDGRGHIIHRQDGTLEKSYDEYESTQPKRERCYAEWTADGKSVLSGRVSKLGGVLVWQSTLLDSGVQQTTYSINANLYAECQQAPDGTTRWMWWQGSPGKGSKWFEEVTLGAGESATRQSLQFFRPAADPSAQPVRLSTVAPYSTAADKSQTTVVTFFREDGVTEEFRQHWSRDWRQFYGEEAYMSGNNGSGAAYGEWRLIKTEEMDKDVNSRRNLEPSHYEQFRGDVRDSAVEQLRAALAGTVTKDDVPELKWHVLDLPVF
ncbi:hypothetical protein BH10CYA1_BH10CYA1_32140 [soil metagenome]